MPCPAAWREKEARGRKEYVAVGEESSLVRFQPLQTGAAVSLSSFCRVNVKLLEKESCCPCEKEVREVCYARVRW
jgi:hypothetical protein